MVPNNCSSRGCGSSSFVLRVDHGYRTHWLSEILKPESHFDGALAVILDLLPKLTQLSIQISDYQPLPITQNVIHQDLAKVRCPKRPPGNLETLRVHGLGNSPGMYSEDVYVAIQPNSKHVNIEGVRTFLKGEPSSGTHGGRFRSCTGKREAFARQTTSCLLMLGQWRS